jgi:hypothetical protein
MHTRGTRGPAGPVGPAGPAGFGVAGPGVPAGPAGPAGPWEPAGPSHAASSAAVLTSATPRFDRHDLVAVRIVRFCRKMPLSLCSVVFQEGGGGTSCSQCFAMKGNVARGATTPCRGAVAAAQVQRLEVALELHPDKTRLLRFGRYAAPQRRERGERGSPETFHFLGFSHLCGQSKRGRFLLMLASPWRDAASAVGSPGRECAGCRRGGSRLPASCTRGRVSDLTSGPKAGAECVRRARSDRCGGRPEPSS